MKSLLMLGIFTVLVLLAVVSLTNILPTAKATAVLSQQDIPLDNYDIRADQSDQAISKLAAMRGELRDTGPETPIESRFKIERNAITGVNEIIENATGPAALISARQDSSRATVLKTFIANNRSLFGDVDSNQLIKTADYTNPDGNLSFVRFEQKINGIPVFGSEVTAAFSRKNEMFRIINNLIPAIESGNVSSEFGTPENAIEKAAAHINARVPPELIRRIDSQRPEVQEFRSTGNYSELTTEKFYFPVGNGIVPEAWRVMFLSASSAYYVVIDATDGTLLWRQNLVMNQTVPATYSVYGNTLSVLKTADSPSPFTPGCLAPTGCAQPPAIARTNFTLIGNEPPYTFNNTGWIPDGGLPVRTPANPNITDGNNVEAGIDRDGSTGVDENGWAFGTPSRVFSHTYNPGPGLPPPGEEPLPTPPQPYPPTQYQQGSVTHGFYTINRWHDEMYRFGFTEQARNFQHDNFGRGGVGGDRLSLEIQDSTGTNGSTFTIVAEGSRPRVQTFIWTGPTPDRDGALDSHNVVHEMTHGLSHRLIGNATGLGTNMAAGMGEGWSDFYAIALLAGTTDDRLGTHTLLGYATFNLAGTGFDSNYYYGIRRFPYAVRALRGPNGLPHNPLTFRYLNAGCQTLIGTPSTNPNSAYPRNPFVAVGTNCDQIHNMGEIWASALWEVRDQLVQRHGAGEGTRRVLQYTTDGMKLSPLNPTIIQARDAILAAVSVSDPLDVGPVYRGFAIRGMGSGAAVNAVGSGNNNTVVTESFDIPLQFRRPARADFDGDGRSDVSVFRPSDGNWYLNRSTTGFVSVNWGLSTDDPVPDDYDGDGNTDIAVFRPSTSEATPDYFILRSTDSTVQYVWWGIAGDIALSEDFDGDNKGDQAIYRPSTGQFWARRSADGSALSTTPLPLGGIPLTGDFDGDGRGDFATYTDGTWNILRSEAGYAAAPIFHWGTTGDKVVHADYDGDGKDDIAVYRPSSGAWYITQSAGGDRFQNFGISTDIPTPADYDGDGRADIGVYRNGIWYVDRSTGGILITGFGLSGDKPLPAAYLP